MRGSVKSRDGLNGKRDDPGSHGHRRGRTRRWPVKPFHQRVKKGFRVSEAGAIPRGRVVIRLGFLAGVAGGRAGKKIIVEEKARWAFPEESPAPGPLFWLRGDRRAQTPSGRKREIQKSTASAWARKAGSCRSKWRGRWQRTRAASNFAFPFLRLSEVVIVPPCRLGLFSIACNVQSAPVEVL